MIKLIEGLRVDEEGRDEEDGVLASQFGMTRELGRPALWDRSLAEIAGLTSKSRCKDAAAISELIGVVGVRGDVVAEVLCIIRRIARDSSRKAVSVGKKLHERQKKYLRHVKGDEELEVSSRLPGGFVAV